MKIYSYIMGIVISLTLFNCQSPVLFTEPQPADEAELSSIPEEYRGIYWCDTDSITMIISERDILKQMLFETKLAIADIDSTSSLSFENDILYSEELNGTFPARREGDTIISQISITDTLFSRSTGAVLKFYRGHLVLNQPLENSLWDVSLLSLKHNDLLSMTQADIPENLEELEEITRVKKYASDEDEKPIQIKMTPTKAEFDEILSQGLLFQGSCQEFKRIFPLLELPL